VGGPSTTRFRARRACRLVSGRSGVRVPSSALKKRLLNPVWRSVQAVAALNIHFGFIQLDAIGRHPRGACVLEVTLTGAEEQAAFALLRDGGDSSYDRVSYFARRLQKQRAEQGLSEPKVTKTFDTDSLRLW
jgi:hypothetical protein